jgi:glycine cleavage system H lipoate-binding protein
MTYDLVSAHSAKLLEYGLSIGYLVLFVFFWRYVQGGKPAPARAAVRAVRHPAGWFHLPDGVHLHPGHTWARVEAGGVVTVGMDDLATRLVGPLEVKLPAPGACLQQGEPALAVTDGARSVDLAAPVDGTVLAVNRAAAEEPGRLEDAYGRGWLFKVKPPRFAANVRQLFSGAAAREWLEGASQALAARLSPQLGHVLQDGGTPVNGIARELDPEHWDEIARKFFRT